MSFIDKISLRCACWIKKSSLSKKTWESVNDYNCRVDRLLNKCNACTSWERYWETWPADFRSLVWFRHAENQMNLITWNK